MLKKIKSKEKKRSKPKVSRSQAINVARRDKQNNNVETVDCAIVPFAMFLDVAFACMNLTDDKLSQIKSEAITKVYTLAEMQSRVDRMQFIRNEYVRLVLNASTTSSYCTHPDDFLQPIMASVRAFANLPDLTPMMLLDAWIQDLAILICFEVVTEDIHNGFKKCPIPIR